MKNDLTEVADTISFLIDDGKIDEARTITNKLLRLHPKNFSLLVCQGRLNLLENRFKEASDAFRCAIENEPNFLYSHLMLIESYLNLMELDLAESAVSLALERFPQDIFVINYAARINYYKLDFNRALDFYQQIIEIDENAVEGYHGKGMVFRCLERFDEALINFNKAIALVQNSSSLFTCRGNVLQHLGDYSRAIEDYNRALEIEPTFEGALRNLAVCEIQRHNFREGMRLIEFAIEKNPNNAELLFIQSGLHLSHGNFKEGWLGYEFRWQTSQMKNYYRAFDKPIWLGNESIKNKTILIHAEQGLGDTIQFSRYISLVKEQGAQIIFEVQEGLWEIMNTIDQDINVIKKGDAIPNFDFHCPLLSLPLAFKTEISNIPNKTPYLFSTPEKSFFWKKKLESDKKIKVGIVWQTGFRPTNPESWHENKKRDIKLSNFSRLLDLDYLEIISLQKGNEAEYELLNILESEWKGKEIKNFASEIKSFSDTAAIIENLDLVISVCTSVAHLAGAMNKPTWILIPYNHCWRWLVDGRNTSPWYSSVKLYRQNHVNNWTSVIDEIFKDLKRLK